MKAYLFLYSLFFSTIILAQPSEVIYDFFHFVDTTKLKTEYAFFDIAGNPIQKQEINKLDSCAKYLTRLKLIGNNYLPVEKQLTASYKKQGDEWKVEEYLPNGEMLKSYVGFKNLHGKNDYTVEDRAIDSISGTELIVQIKKNDSLKPPPFIKNSYNTINTLSEFLDIHGNPIEQGKYLESYSRSKNTGNKLYFVRIYLIYEKLENEKSILTDKILVSSFEKKGEEWEVKDYYSNGNLLDSYKIIQNPDKTKNSKIGNREIDPNTGNEKISYIIVLNTIRK